MKYFLTLILFLFFVIKSNCQVIKDLKSYKKNAAFVEVLGHNRGLFSINYERIFNNKNTLYSIRSGAGFSPGVNIKGKRLKGSGYFPIVFSILKGGKKRDI